MEVTVENEMLALYGEMKKFDFKMPFSVTTEQVDDNNEAYCTLGARKKRQDSKSIYFHDENTHAISNEKNVSRNDNCDVVRNENDITGLNKPQDTGPLTPTWISHLLYENVKDPHYSSRTQTDKNHFTYSVSGNLLFRNKNCQLNSVNGPRKPSHSVTLHNRNVSYNSQYSRYQLNNKLKVLSTNLISILRDYSYYATVIKNDFVTGAMKLDVKMKYLRARNYYFQSSREIVEQIILPRINNTNFIRNFIYKTRVLGICTNLHCTINDVECVYKDLIAWVSHRRSKTALKAKQNTQIQTSTNIEFTETSFNDNISNNQSQNSPYVRDSKTCLLSYGRPGNEFSININTKILSSINNNVDMNNTQCNLEQEKRLNQTINVSSNRGNSLTCEALNHDAVPDIQNPTRCESIDSGFISPGTEQNNTGQMIEDPYIAHNITSLNPNTTYEYILPGNCTVCGAMTSKKCLGCFNIYYCSSGCQGLHWTKHKADCMNSLN